MLTVGEYLTQTLRQFARKEDGATTIEFVVIFPVFMTFFLMIIESGFISMRKVALERGLDITTRELRLGILHRDGFATDEEYKQAVRARICETTALIGDCLNQLEIEAIRQDPRNWSAVSSEVTCVDRGDLGTSTTSFTATDSNELIVLKACARIDPTFPLVGIGRAIRVNNDDLASGGSFALTSITAFVVEP